MREINESEGLKLEEISVDQKALGQTLNREELGKQIKALAKGKNVMLEKINALDILNELEGRTLENRGLEDSKIEDRE